MRVAIVQETAAPDLGGAETSVSEMAAALVELGADVTVLHRAAPDSADDERRDQFGVRWRGLPAAGSAKWRSTLRFIEAADRLCRDERYDIVHAVTPCFAAKVYQPRGGTYPETVRRNLALEPTLVHRALKWFDRRLNWRQRLLSLVERRLLTDARAPVVAAVSTYVKQQVHADYGLPDERVRVVFNGVAIPKDASATREREPNQLRALFVAHNFKLKGLRELIAAWPRIHEATSMKLTVVGRDRAARYQRLTQRGGVQAAIEFVGATDDIESWWSRADLLIHPTWYDPCSRVVLEALVRGKPVVTTRFNGAAEVVTSETGVVIDSPRATGALTKAVIHCASDAQRTQARQQMDAAREQLSIERHARELAALYEDVLRERAPGVA